MIHLENVSKSFGKQLIFNNLNLSIDKCGFYAFIGPSGCGKSTLLNMISQTEAISSGNIKVEGKVATIYQDYQLIDEFTVEDNISLLTSKKRIRKICDNLQITDYIDQYPNELSGGQQQRVGIARAINLNPDIILCDEPTESLDIENKIIVMEYLKKLSANKIVIIVSHDLDLIYQYVDVVYKIENYNLIQQVLHQPTKDVVIKSKKIKLNSQQIIKKLLLNKEMKVNLLLAFFSALLLFMYGFSSKAFYLDESPNVLNINKLYVKMNTMETRVGIKHASHLQRIVPFKEAIIDDKNYIANILPVVDNPNFSLPCHWRTKLL